MLWPQIEEPTVEDLRAAIESFLTQFPFDPLLTMERLTQPVATHGNGFRLISPFSRPPDLPPIATRCDRSAP